ncbi:aminodeoxychorismate lyase [Thiomicrorhabdus hydrogeniphila]
MEQLDGYWINGIEQSQLSLQDRAVQYGDGFFTTILVVDKSVLNWQAHCQRIKHSCEVLMFPQPNLDELSDWLKQALNTFFKKNSAKDCVLKIVITRGSGGMGYQMPEQIEPNYLFYIKPSPIQIQRNQLTAIEPMTIGLCNTLASIGSLAGVKSVNRLENVMARTEIAKKGYAEGLMLNANNEVICGTQSNLYMIKSNTIFTPKIQQSGVAGTTRFQINNLVQSLGFEFKEQRLTLVDIEQADEVFFTNAVRGVQPVKAYLDIEYSTEQSKKIHQAWSNWQKNNAVAVKNLKSIT